MGLLEIPGGGLPSAGGIHYQFIYMDEPSFAGKFMGGVWFAAGIIFHVVRIRFTRDNSIKIDFTDI